MALTSVQLLPKRGDQAGDFGRLFEVYEVAGVFDDVELGMGHEAIEFLRRLQPELVLLNYRNRSIAIFHLNFYV